MCSSRSTSEAPSSSRSKSSWKSWKTLRASSSRVATTWTPRKECGGGTATTRASCARLAGSRAPRYGRDSRQPTSGYSSKSVCDLVLGRVSERTHLSPRVDVLGVHVNASSFADALETFTGWIASGRREYVTFTGVHGVMESQRDPELVAIHNAAGFV